jgi:hypothetical protein
MSGGRVLKGVRNSLACLIAFLVLPVAVADAAVQLQGPDSGPVGVIVPMLVPACGAAEDEDPVLRVYIDGRLLSFVAEPDEDESFYASLITGWDREATVGSHRIVVRCEATKSGAPTRIVWTDPGFDFTITGLARTAKVSTDRATPGMELRALSGAPHGSDPCPQLEGVTWSQALVWTLDPRVTSHWSENYNIGPLTFGVTGFPVTIPLDLTAGSEVGVDVVCRATSTFLRPFPVMFDYETAEVAVVASGTEGEQCGYGAKRQGDSNCDGKVRVAVIGDSYISGEGSATGERPYRPGTDRHAWSEDDVDLCHRTEQSWAVQVAKGLAPGAKVVDATASGGLPGPQPANGDRIWFLACSGAVVDNLDGRGIPTDADSAVQYGPEGEVQLEQLERVPDDVDLVFLSVGGNDAGFGEVISHCLVTRCAADRRWQEDRLDALQRVGDRVADVAIAIRKQAPEAELYQVGYPDPLRPRSDPPCGSLKPKGEARVLITVQTPAGPRTIDAASGAGSIEANEQRWVSEEFLPRLNERLRVSTEVSGAHFVDVDDALEGHPICSTDPYANGVTFGDDIGFFGLGRRGLGVVGNESFHPTSLGQDRLREVALDQYGADGAGPGFGSLPNPDFTPLDAYEDPDTLQAWFVGTGKDTQVFVASGAGYAVVRHGEANTPIVVPTFSLGTVAARAVTDANGNATIPIRIPPNAAPGIHHAEIWTEDGERLGSAPYAVVAPDGCSGDPDSDGDRLADVCDGDPADGPLADYDGDGIANGADLCPLVADPLQLDADGDDEGDVCDPDEGVDRLSVDVIGGPFAAPALPSAPRLVSASPDGAGAALVTWEPPELEGDRPRTGYLVTADPGGDTTPVTADGTSVRVTDLMAGDEVRFAIRAVSPDGSGPAAATDAITIAGGGDGGGEVPEPGPGAGGPGAGAPRPGAGDGPPSSPGTGPGSVSRPHRGTAGDVAGDRGRRCAARVRVPRRLGLARVLARGVRIRIRTASACTVSVVVRARGTSVARHLVSLRASRSRRIVLKPRRRAVRALRRLVEKRPKAVLSVRITARLRTGSGRERHVRRVAISRPSG